MSYDYTAFLTHGITKEGITKSEHQNNGRYKTVLNDDKTTNPIITPIEASTNRADRLLRLAVLSRYAESTLGKWKENGTDGRPEEWGKKFRNALRGNWTAQEKISRDLHYSPDRNPAPASCPSGLDNTIATCFDREISLPTRHSALITFHFRLTTPWYAADESEFGLIDNQCAKDPLTGRFMIRATSWKGNMRTMLEQEALADPAKAMMINEKLRILFGPDNDQCKNDNQRREGRLVFYPTVFYGEGGEVICPHDRDKRSALNPIPYEVVPAGATGELRVLYFPFDLVGKSDADADAVADIAFTLENIGDVITKYGFSAKKTIGWGLAKVETFTLDVGGSLGEAFVKNGLWEKSDDPPSIDDVWPAPIDNLDGAIADFSALRQKLDEKTEAHNG